MAIGLFLGACAASAVTTILEVRQFPPALTLEFADLPEQWTLEMSTDLTNWVSIITSGEQAPKSIAFTVTNENAAQYYRIR